MSGATPSDAGLASGLVNAATQVGGAVGLAVLAILSAQRTQALRADGHAVLAALNRGHHVAYPIGTALIVAGFAVAAAVLLPPVGATAGEQVATADAEPLADPALGRRTSTARRRHTTARDNAGRVATDELGA